MDLRQAKQYRDSLIEEHVGIVKEKDIYDITIQEAVLIGSDNRFDSFDSRRWL